MWRRYGDALYALLVFLVFTAEAVALGVLTWVFLFRREGVAGEPRLRNVLLAVLIVTALALTVVTVYTVVYQALSVRRQKVRASRVARWSQRWTNVVLRGDSPPPKPIPDEAVQALLDLRDTLTGTQADRAAGLLRRYDVPPTLVSRARGGFRFRPRYLAARLDALEALAKARAPETLLPLLELVEDRHLSIRVMALRCATRTLAADPSVAVGSNADAFVEAVRRSGLPSGAIEGCLVLLEDAAPDLLQRFLRVDEDPRTLMSALEATGRLRALSAAAWVAAIYAASGAVEIRAGSLRAFARMGYVPPEARRGVLGALSDEADSVRIQATHAAVALDFEEVAEELWRLLGDSAWFVRRAAAGALLHFGQAGADMLRRAAREYPDRFARHMAVQILLDGGHLDVAEAVRLRGVG